MTYRRQATGPTLAQLILSVLGAGLFAGFVAGLFGIGGGIVIVPALYAVFGFLHVDPEVRTHLAIGTSLSTIIMTSLRSLASHHARGAVDFTVLKNWTPWIAVGAVLGAVAADIMSARLLTTVFALGAFAVAVRAAFDGKAARAPSRPPRQMPEGPLRVGMATGTGFFSSLFGIGGGVFGVVVMTRFGREVHQAVGTSAGFGLAIAVPGAIAFMATGWNAAGLPVGSVGYVNLIGFAIIAAMATITTPMGVRLAHRMNRLVLLRLFAAYVALTAVAMLYATLAQG
ncbi:MAG: sulfite exporter TauE/SafE family protein [Geminicoccaceae bacterium]